ncbi:MAG: TIGR00725 family protein [Actinomycetota bacterium]|nr:TIGR00725 family protein [Actinomycetota bacterium]
MSHDQPYIAVVGTGTPDAAFEALAEDVGRHVALAGGVLVCGGLEGVMAAASRGAAEAGGLALGILPGSDRRAANRWVQVAVATGVGELRNALLVRAADVMIAIGGGFGTLSEIAFAVKTGVPVVGLRTWDLARAGAPDAIEVASDAPDAVRRALRHASR